MNHMVNMCPFTKFGGRLQFLHEAGDDAIHWLEFTAATALAKIEMNCHCVTYNWYDMWCIMDPNAVANCNHGCCIKSGQRMGGSRFCT